MDSRKSSCPVRDFYFDFVRPGFNFEHLNPLVGQLGGLFEEDVSQAPDGLMAVSGESMTCFH
jgi:hypothetical protein